MIQKHISLPEDLDQQIQERVERLQASEERVIKELIEQGLKSVTQEEDRFSVLDSIRAKNKDLDPQTVEHDVTAVVEAVRQELYGRTNQPKSSLIQTSSSVARSSSAAILTSCWKHGGTKPSYS